MLEICKSFFEHLNKQQVRYCHWKSNEHLEEALRGETDLDVLVHIDDKEALEASFAIFPFKKILSPPEKQFPGMSDYLGFDEETGELIHLHVHHYLVLGQKYIKNHYLPLEDWVFDNLILRGSVYIPCPEVELLFLVIRANMKPDMLSLVKHAIKDCTSAHYTAYPQSIEQEFFSLIDQADQEKLNTLLLQSGLPLNPELYSDFIDVFSRKELKFYHIIKAQFVLLQALQDYRRDKTVLVHWRYFQFFAATLPVIKHFKNFKRKTIDGTAKSFAIVGADGSGKSTLIADLNKWLSWKLTVKQYYYGIPKNTINRVKSFLQRVFNKLGLTSAVQALDERFWIYVANYRRQISFAIRNDVIEGKVVITDRFPLKAFHSMAVPMDGPRLGLPDIHVESAKIQQELDLYDQIQLPDRIFVLQVDIDELRRRKTDLTLETHQLKAQAVNKLVGDETTILINANKSYDEVILEIKCLIWSEL